MKHLKDDFSLRRKLIRLFMIMANKERIERLKDSYLLYIAGT